MSPRTCARLIVCTALLSVLGLAVPGQGPRLKAKKYALLVGVRVYDDNRLRDLKFPENDVEELAALLGGAGYDEVVVLTTGRGQKADAAKPTAANIRKEIARLLEKLTKRD